jgi:hypothetical protein
VLPLDGLLVRAARGRDALDVAMGERLDVLSRGDRTLRLGYARLGDYAVARLGVEGRSAMAMARLARKLRERPLLREAVRRGEVSTRKAEEVAAVAFGADEEPWVARARSETVRGLRAAVRAAKGKATPPGDPGRWDRISIPISPEARAKLDEAMALAGQVLGSPGTAPKWQRLEAICQEFLGAHPAGEAEAPADVFLRGEAADLLEATKAALELETDRWSYLETLPPVPALPGLLDADGEDPVTDADLLRVDGELRELAAMRARWDEVLGHAAMLLQNLGLWRDMGFASFAHYCTERLGMGKSTVGQRAWLARRFETLPSLRTALREGRLSYEQARLLARLPDDETAAARIPRAEELTCAALRRELEAGEESQMCERGELDLRVPEEVADLLAEAVRAAREAAGRWLPLSECIERIAGHFIDTWKGAAKKRRTPGRRVLERDRHLCTAPGCTREAEDAHHVVFRSHGGGDEAWNQTGLCPPHHLHGVHRGYLRVAGRAPDQLRWAMLAPPAAPLRLPSPWPPPAWVE